MLRFDPPRDLATGRVLVFLPGFMSAAASYSALLRPLTRDGTSVVVPQLYRRGPAALAGRFGVEQEAAAAAAVVRGAAGGRRDRTVVLGGHSRGGQAAWRAAGLLADEGLPAALVLVDPVDGAGRRPSVPAASASPPRLAGPCLVIGAGISGRCAPAAVNHEVFALAMPAAQHVVVADLGHGDVLDDRPAAAARRLCGGAAQPAAGRTAVTDLLGTFLVGLAEP